MPRARAVLLPAWTWPGFEYVLPLHSATWVTWGFHTHAINLEFFQMLRLEAAAKKKVPVSTKIFVAHTCIHPGPNFGFQAPFVHQSSTCTNSTYIPISNLIPCARRAASDILGHGEHSLVTPPGALTHSYNISCWSYYGQLTQVAWPKIYIPRANQILIVPPRQQAR